MPLPVLPLLFVCLFAFLQWILFDGFIKTNKFIRCFACVCVVWCFSTEFHSITNGFIYSHAYTHTHTHNIKTGQPHDIFLLVLCQLAFALIRLHTFVFVGWLVFSCAIQSTFTGSFVRGRTFYRCEYYECTHTGHAVEGGKNINKQWKKNERGHIYADRLTFK